MKETKRSWMVLAFIAAALFVLGSPTLYSQGTEKKPGEEKGMEKKPEGEKAKPPEGEVGKEKTPPGLEKLAAAHGGVVQATKEFMIETVFQADGIRLFLYDQQAKPLSMKDVACHAKIEFSDPSQKPIELDLAYQEAGKGGEKAAPPAEKGAVPPKSGEGVAHGNAAPQDSLWAASDFANVKEGGATAHLAIQQLPGKQEKEATLTVPFKLAQIEKPAKPEQKPEPKKPEPKKPEKP